MHFSWLQDLNNGRILIEKYGMDFINDTKIAGDQGEIQNRELVFDIYPKYLYIFYINIFHNRN